MAGERHFKCAAHTGSVDGRNPRFATGFKLAEKAAHLAYIVEQGLDRALRVFGLLLLEFLEHAFQHGQVGATGETFLTGCYNNALDLVIARRCIDDGIQFLHRFDGEDVHRLLGHVPGNESNAVGVGFNFEIYISHCLNLPLHALDDCRRAHAGPDAQGH
ncbi:hypothetical protein D9M69_587450 [compost metagenome]